jgi:BirA family biotin operon repressor/biotin-[acetyl-CoA-carboxylase] ligase
MRKFTIGYPLIRLQSVDSTNVYAAQLLRNSKVTEGTVILAVHQTQGKGQGSNRWVSEAGCNLLFSLILLPDFMLAERQFYLSMCVSSAILDFINPIVQSVRIKWPNDILINGRKLAGILIENTILDRNLHTSIVGIGININQKEFPPDLPNPTSLSIATGKEYDLSDSLTALLKSLNTHIFKLYRERFAEIKTTYLNNLWGLNEWAVYKDSSGTFEGRIADVADSGELIVVLRSGATKQYGFKEIAFQNLV